MAQFLSDAWFTEVEKLNNSVGELNLPPNLASLVVNVKIEGDNNIQMYLKDGKLSQGQAGDAVSEILIDGDTLQAIISRFDVNAALEAFMMGKIRINGDMSKVMALQTAKPTPEQKALYKQILAMTEF